MAHEVENMLYVGNVPWHGLGTKLEVPPTIEEAIVAAGLDWQVDRKPLVIQGSDQLVPAYATVRSTDNSVLGVVGNTYRVLQNIDAFKWFQPYIDSGEVEIHTAGSLRNGKHVWVLAQIKHEGKIEIVDGDEICQFALLSNSHDGTSAIRAGLTATRVVCANTLAAAQNSKASKLIRVRHSERSNIALAKVRESLDLARREFRATTDGMRRMAQLGVSIEDLKSYVKEVFEPKVTLETEGMTNGTLERLCDKITPLFEGGRGMDLPGVKGTMWGAYNSVTEFLTWERGRSADTRLESLWFGPAANLNQRAYEVAVKRAA
jgi:phage/plasmid-like protein (TIGR03299 family)